MDEREKQSLQETLAASEDAQRLLDDIAFSAAVAECETRYFRQWKEAETPQKREDIHARMSALDDVVTALGTIRDRGTTARFHLDKAEEATRRDEQRRVRGTRPIS